MTIAADENSHIMNMNTLSLLSNIKSDQFLMTFEHAVRQFM